MSDIVLSDKVHEARRTVKIIIVVNKKILTILKQKLKRLKDYSTRFRYKISGKLLKYGSTVIERLAKVLMEFEKNILKDWSRGFIKTLLKKGVLVYVRTYRTNHTLKSRINGRRYT